ncbi:ABC transporter transmembrane domain-containing protein [Aeromicrobium sp. CF3.5]|uniref:ABC transporter transmembrane domain-containing protein n=1 Tax=Aeromicrobium sp. CF3.5 TaxID=3373078 RepID=UPI003EE71ACA
MLPRTGLSLIWRGITRHRREVLIGFPLIMAWHLCETLVPVVIGVVIDQGIADPGSDPGASRFVASLGLVVATFLVLAASYRFGSRFLVRAIEDEGHLLRTEIAGHVLHPRGARTDLLPGEVLSLATSDATLVPAVLHQLAFSVAAVTSLTTVAVYLLIVDLQLGLLILIGVPAVVLTIQVATPLVARRTHTQQERTAEATGLATDLVQGLRPLKGIGGEHVAVARYRRSSGEAARATVGLARSWGYLAGLTTGLSGLLLAAVVLLAGTRALSGDISIGELIAIVGLTQFLAEPIAQLGEVSASFARSRASAQRIRDFLATAPLVAAGTDAPVGSPPLLALTDARVGPLLGLDLVTHDGEVLAVVIEDPATSDALVAVLSGEQDLESGSARLGDVLLEHLSIEGRRSALLVGSHHTTMLEGTIRSIVDPAGVLDARRLDDVLTASAASDVVDLHPDGLDRAVRAEGSSLSGGQRQRLSLARALARDPQVLVLQDPTSAIDPVTEQHVANGLTGVRRHPGRSTILITSSPALLRAADRVVHVREGRATAHGSHENLLDEASYRAAVLR